MVVCIIYTNQYKQIIATLNGETKGISVSKQQIVDYWKDSDEIVIEPDWDSAVSCCWINSYRLTTIIKH